MALGVPGELVRSALGYHILQIDQRVLEGQVKPLGAVASECARQVESKAAKELRRAFIEPLQNELGFSLTEAGERDTTLLREEAIPDHELLGKVAGKDVLESDFRWFLEDAILPSQRTYVTTRPGARKSMLRSYLEMLLVAEKARQLGFLRTAEYRLRFASARQGLLAEFLRERERQSPRFQAALSEEERARAQRAYLDAVRAEVGLVVLAGSQTPL